MAHACFSIRGAFAAGLVVVLTMAAPAALAGRSCEVRKPTVASITSGMQLAERTAAALDAEFARAGVQVVALGRAGQDLSQHHLRYSHFGWAYRTQEGTWRVVHKLNECGTAVGTLYRQGLGEFFMDDAWRYETVWAVPTNDVQQHLLPVLRDNQRARALQHAPYSMVSYAWGTRYQQSNQWAIETLAAAMEPATVRTREQAQAWLKFKGYVPTPLKIGPLTRLGGRISQASVAFDDHPNHLRFADRIETVTVDSVLAWLPLAQLAAPPVTLRLAP